MDNLPTEIVAHIGLFAGAEGLPALRSTGRLANNASINHFARICFRSFEIPVTPESLYKLYRAASHPKFQDLASSLLAHAWSTFDAFANRDQKVTIQVKVNAVAIRGSTSIETTINQFPNYITRANSFKSFLQEPLTLNFPSPPESPRTAPLRTLFFRNLAIDSITENIHVLYSDLSPIAGITYDATTQTLLIEGLEVKHLLELRSFIRGIHLKKLVLRHTAMDTTTIERVCFTHCATLGTVLMEDVKIWDLWSEGDSVPACWKESLASISRLPALKICSLPVQVSNFFASGMATVHHNLEVWINNTQW
ncbi:unnamed protein product [Aureobasidium mustum]|uniref:F-box domain-containing protein n=1 Tax=Aureobasidium mustum TaxID=2773714 RepID=A0A9N8JKY4_9PEZI|nr:unnamed protein product [Aureobasidium mustum]